MNTHCLILCLTALVLTPTNNHGVSGQGGLNLRPQGQYQPTTSQDRLNIFDVELLRAAAETSPGNFMISPASVKSVLGMILEGAKGSCAEQLRTNLRLPTDQAQARDILGRIISKLKVRTPGITIENANKIFLSNRVSARREYENLLNSVYSSEITSVDYRQPQAAVNTINNWVNSATQGKIPRLVEQGNFDGDTVMVLANALYFKGMWKMAFNERLTSPNCFYVQNNCVQTNMMENQGTFNYGYISEINAQAIELPYVGDKFSMLIIMPHDKNGLTDSFIKDLSYSPISRIMQEMDSTDVLLSMPRLQVDYSEDLVSTLQKMGIQEIFGKKADLTGIVQSDQSPQVDSIVHRTRLEINEQGSIAAAATGAMVIPLIGTSTARMAIDHPFLFFIRDVESGVILFEGKINRPTETVQTQYQPQQVQNQNSYTQPQQAAQNQNRFVQPQQAQNQNSYIQPQQAPQNTYSQPPVVRNQPDAVQNYLAANAGQRAQQTYVQNPQYTQPTNPQRGNVYQTPVQQPQQQYNGKNYVPDSYSQSALPPQQTYIPNHRHSPASIIPQNSQPSPNSRQVSDNRYLNRNENNNLGLQIEGQSADNRKYYRSAEKDRSETYYQQPQPVDYDGITFTL